MTINEYVLLPFAITAPPPSFTFQDPVIKENIKSVI